MKRTAFYLAAITAATTVAAIGGAARAELFVVRLGGGSSIASGVAAPVFLDRFNNDGTVSASPAIALPTALSGLNQPFTNSFTATAEGFIAESADGNYLTLAGYGAIPGTTGVAATASATTPRVVARVTLSNGSVDTTTALGDAYTGSGIRAAVTSNGTDIWTAGTVVTTGGTRYATFGATTSTQISTAPTNTRVIDIFNNQLYTATASGAFLGVATVGTGLPTASGQTTSLLPGFPTSGTHSSYDFWFKDASTLYVADDGGAASGGGIQKWTFDSGTTTWSLAYNLTTAGVRGLTGVVDGADTVIYATTTQATANKLVKVIDTGAGSASTDLATAPTNTVFRGVEFVSSVVAPPTNNSDFNNDGVVDGDDFLIWQQGNAIAALPNVKSTGDANGDLAVNGTDLGIWAAHYNLPPTVPAVGSVPEPASLALAGLALAGLIAAKRRR